jgi:hypothetical protein
VGQVVKYAGGVQRGFCVLLGILLTGLIEILVFAAPFSVAILVSLPLVLLGTYLHIAHPVRMVLLLRSAASLTLNSTWRPVRQRQSKTPPRRSQTDFFVFIIIHVRHMVWFDSVMLTVMIHTMLH